MLNEPVYYLLAYSPGTSIGPIFEGGPMLTLDTSYFGIDRGHEDIVLDIKQSLKKCALLHEWQSRIQIPSSGLGLTLINSYEDAVWLRNFHGRQREIDILAIRGAALSNEYSPADGSQIVTSYQSIGYDAFVTGEWSLVVGVLNSRSRSTLLPTMVAQCGLDPKVFLFRTESSARDFQRTYAAWADEGLVEPTGLNSSQQVKLLAIEVIADRP